MILRELADAFGKFTKQRNTDDIEVKGLEIDSRSVKPGDLFFCISGFTVDGHLFAEDAINSGAVAIVAEKELDVSVPVIVVRSTTKALALAANVFYDNPTSKLQLFGVTGTNGKTTVTYLLNEIFNHYQKKTGLIGTIQMKIGEKTFDVKNTTPDALFLQKNFRKMVDNQVNVAFMEVSSHALDLGRTHGCEFDIAIFTNLSQDHLDYHKNMEDYLHAKSLLFSQLGSGINREYPKFAVINEDDPVSQYLIKSTAQQVVTYGINSKKANVTATDIILDANGSRFTINVNGDKWHVASKLMGRFSIYNMLAATTAAFCAGVPINVIKSALEKTEGVRGRFEPVDGGQPFGVIVDYAHTPDSLENVLTTVRSFVKGKVYVVVGCGGDRDRTKRPLMAKIAVDQADLAIFTSDNPRSEDPNQIINDMVEGIDKENYQVILNRKEAITKSIQLAKNEDVVLIAGKGHETYQIIGEDTFEFDDKQVALEAIQARKN
ncbi:UDP-N-acetylmuramoyl-L-alanyl-D-glutamate--2,6-diaminopimelate ligase [Aquibacillus salsiterrae]|uniref:UDP-N-acetylmuramoyl-L-alanyl-D-glutamate--2,6-diaminopimelate ligase n=1 Tax=Aquibacillus salsiterrae TaxID=2950439 RepID=A0A9X4AFX6_9BACI|nr:UDP-N-acetylmuramoyl-L-alanyl-D-glutamate--2,6-diaminopimelate ligase [Aquibacillus salsiterrae]MDC3416483.1 UDP-N-acetylmuramoyl-L-alanyl-D-glutamate--2,6-diaminopimelate ligase [Aquibacillus salsiterrae]